MMNRIQKLVILSLLTSLIASFFYYLAIWLGVFISSLFLYVFASLLIGLNVFSLYVNYRAKQLKILLMLVFINLFIFTVFSALTFSTI